MTASSKNALAAVLPHSAQTFRASRKENIVWYGRRLAATFIASTSLVAGADQASSEALCERELLPFERMVSRIKAEPGAEVISETATLLTLVEPARHIVWTLGRPGGPVETAYICRRIVQEHGQVVIKLTAQCFGRTPNCDGLIAKVLEEQSKATTPLRRQ